MMKIKYKNISTSLKILLITLVVFACKKESSELNISPKPELVGVMVEVPAGKFIRGSEAGLSMERPMDTITITNAFLMSATEVTNLEFCEFLNNANVPSTGIMPSDTFGEKPFLCASDTARDSRFNQGIIHNGSQWIPVKGFDYYPAIYISWFGAFEYCKWNGGRLPTEAEWEYAAGGAVLDPLRYALSDDYNDLSKYAWNNSNSSGQSKPVGNLTPNELGLYDMLGNVNEWCNDWFDPFYYQTSQDSSWLSDPMGADSITASTVNKYSPDYYPYIKGSRKIFRGGSYVEPKTSGTQGTHRIAYRGHMLPYKMWNSYGFRFVKNIE